MANISPWDYCQDGNPIGGGVGYDRIITSGDVTITTSDTYSTFRTKVEAAISGQVVFINSNVTMDLTSLGSGTISVPGGVTIASDRGNNGSEGALLYTNQMKYNNNGGSDRPVFVTVGTGVRFTGFTMRGPYGFSGTYAANDSMLPLRRLKHGIASNYNNTEVDNMHIFNFPASATGFGRMSSNDVFFGPRVFSNGHKCHHNYIHNNLQNGMGYGVSTDNCDIAIYGNMFHSHRHDIAGTGRVGNTYEAYCNIVINEFPANTGFLLNGPVGAKVYTVTADGSGNAVSYNPQQTGNTHHNFDMHPEFYCNNDNWNYNNCGPPTSPIYVHHNDFQDDGVARHTAIQNVSISGVPRDGQYTRVEYNRTVRTDLGNWNDAGTGFEGLDYHIRQGRTLPNSTSVEGEYIATLPFRITIVGNVLNNGDPGGQTGGTQGVSNLQFISTSSNQVEVEENTVTPIFPMEPVTTEIGETYTWTIEPLRNGLPYLDVDDFSIVNVNQLKLNLTPDYENPTDSNTNNIYGCDITVTSTSGATFTRGIGVYVTNIISEGVTSIAFDNPTQTISVGQSVDLSHTFNGGPPLPTNTGVTYFTDSNNEGILSNAGIGINTGIVTFYIIADDTTNGVIQNEMTVTIESVGDIPIVTLTGSPIINHTVGDTYIEYGATYSDTEDGTGDAVVTGDDAPTIDTSVPGTYIVTYSHLDSDLNSSAPVTRTVNISLPNPNPNKPPLSNYDPDKFGAGKLNRAYIGPTKVI